MVMEKAEDVNETGEKHGKVLLCSVQAGSGSVPACSNRGISLDKDVKIVYHFHNNNKCNDRENVAASISESRRLL